MSDFELRYIHPVWDNNSRVISIEKSDRCIEVDKNDCKLSSSEISFSFFDRSVFYFEQII